MRIYCETTTGRDCQFTEITISFQFQWSVVREQDCAHEKHSKKMAFYATKSSCSVLENLAWREQTVMKALRVRGTWHLSQWVLEQVSKYFAWRKKAKLVSTISVWAVWIGAKRPVDHGMRVAILLKQRSAVCKLNIHWAGVVAKICLTSIEGSDVAIVNCRRMVWFVV